MPKPKDLFDLHGRNIILTGGLGLLGRVFVKHLLSYGANLIILDVAEPTSALKQLNLLGPKFKSRGAYFKADITDKKNLLETKRKIIQKFGSIDVLINNAALNPMVASDQQKSDDSFENFDIEKWQKMINVNLTGTMLCCQVFGSAMKSGSSIINIASLYGVLAPDQRIYRKGFIKPVSYTVTKGGVIALTKYLAAYWGKKGIRVNSISPGGIEADQDRDFIRKYSARTPLGRMGRAEELAGILLYLCSDTSSYTSGVNILIDGGLSVW